MSILFFTKKVYAKDEYPYILGVSLEDLCRVSGLFTGHSGRDVNRLLPPHFHREIYPSLRDNYLWNMLDWIRIMSDTDDHGRARIWAYGRAKDLFGDPLEHLRGLLQTSFVSSNQIHLSPFNRQWARASTFPPPGRPWKREIIRDLESQYQDVFDYLITED